MRLTIKLIDDNGRTFTGPKPTGFAVTEGVLHNVDQPEWEAPRDLVWTGVRVYNPHDGSVLLDRELPSAQSVKKGFGLQLPKGWLQFNEDLLTEAVAKAQANDVSRQGHCFVRPGGRPEGEATLDDGPLFEHAVSMTDGEPPRYRENWRSRDTTFAPDAQPLSADDLKAIMEDMKKG